VGPLAATASAQPGQVDKSGLAAFRDATCVHATASAEPSEQGTKRHREHTAERCIHAGAGATKQTQKEPEILLP
jgi:hypothetical protein